MKHGGDLVSYQHLYDGEILDFSSNINPLGYPPVLDEVILRDLRCLLAYPDIQYRALRREIAAYLGCEPDEVMVGNGSVDILDHFCRTASRVVTCVPCFSEYTERARLDGKPVAALPLGPELTLHADMFAKRLRPNDLVILGNPNNPTGRRIAESELRAIQRLTEASGARLLLDEAFFEFCPPDYDSIQVFHGHPNVCVLRAATKFFGLPGIRLGYACMQRDAAAGFRAAALPWRINAIADLAGRVIFRQTAYIQRSQDYISRERDFMLTQLRQIHGLTVFRTEANFMLLKLWHCQENDLFNRLIRQGLLIRKASSFEGLDQRYVRIAIKDHASNLRLIQALHEVMPALRDG